MTSIKEIKQALETVVDLQDPLLTDLASDTRKGVQTALSSRIKQIKASQAEEERLEGMLTYERIFYGKNYSLIAGVDEVGRGPLAGPVVAAAVILPVGCKIQGLNDSKKIPKRRHEEIYQAVQEQALSLGIGMVDSQRIDQVNILEATKEAMMKAIAALDPQPQALLIDALTLDLPLEQEGIIKGDANSMSIAAASIVAKVTRDRLMADYDQEYPGYNFAQHAGYGTRQHLEAIERLGLTPIHRRSFEPIKSMVEEKL